MGCWMGVFCRPDWGGFWLAPAGFGASVGLI